MKHLVEFRSYTLKPVSRDRFHQLILEQSMPMMQRWHVDVIDFGPSAHDDDSYYLIRRYDSLTQRQHSQDAFYGSDEWKLGPREAIVSLIQEYTCFVLELEDAAVQQLRRKGD
ncbi:MAG: NIPSNAP family protein [Chloroflexi bacterium HGW-Chloroflexi-10]|nr:MAG: NIPSNAP family protein [Chloroflexi bacterium HGW-Chloroflexi-10]